MLLSAFLGQFAVGCVRAKLLTLAVHITLGIKTSPCFFTSCVECHNVLSGVTSPMPSRERATGKKLFPSVVLLKEHILLAVRHEGINLREPHVVRVELGSQQPVEVVDLSLQVTD